MGSSLVLQGGAAVTKTLKEAITQTAHGFTVGDAIRWDNASTPPKYVLAKADSASNAEVVGVVNQKSDADNFEVTYHGYIELPQHAGVSAPVLFLSSTVAGGLTYTPPSAVGTVIKPILSRNTNGSGHLVMNYLGTQIGGSSTIAVDEIQPVGTIMPFAGNAIPDTWLECNGASYSVSAYPELYAKLQNISSPRMPMYGYVAKITATGWSVAAVGGYIQFKNNTNTWTTNQPVSGQNLVYDTQAELTGRIIAISGTDAYVQILQRLDSGNLAYPNLLYTLTTGDTSVSSFLYNATASYGARYRLLDSNGQIVHTNNIVSAVSVEAFNSPDLRGRFALGVNASGTLADLEADSALNTAISKNYPMASEGGEEAHALTTGEMPAHNHPQNATNTTGEYYWVSNQVTAQTVGENITTTTPNLTGWEFTRSQTVASQGGNTPHNNMPPYTVVRYIIKAKPYTRAAIIGGIDLPYSNLLVRSTDSNSLKSELLSGISGGDLVFYTNGGEASKTGTERLRIYGSGNTGDILFSGDTNNTSRNPLILSVGGTRIDNNKDDAFFISTKQDGTTVGYFGFNGYSTQTFKYTEWGVYTRGANDSASVNRLYINNLGNVGIATATPGATLDVSGTLKVGDFGGNTNVMVKPTGAISGTAVGKVVPLYSVVTRPPTSFIPAGTWFIFFNCQMNGPNAPDENSVATAAFTLTVPTGQYFALALAYGGLLRPTGDASSQKSGVIGRFFTDTSLQNTNVTPTAYPSIPTGWTEFTEVGTAPFISKRYCTNVAGTNPTATDNHSMVHTDGDGTSIGFPALLNGYAIRIG